MYKVYLSPSTDYRGLGIANYGTESYRMNEIANEIEKNLIEDGNFAVYRNKENMTKEQIIEDSNSIVPDIHIAIHTKDEKGKGIEIYTKVGCEISNGFSKEINKELIRIHYNKGIDNGVIYNDKIEEIMKIKSPSVLIILGCHNNIDDVNWIISNTKLIGKAITEGISNGFKLKPC